MRTVEEYKHLSAAFEADPVEMAQAALGVHIWQKQADIINIVFQKGGNWQIAVKAANGVGKTWVAAVVAYCWLMAYPGSTRVLLVGPKAETLVDGIASEFQRLIAEDEENEQILSSQGRYLLSGGKPSFKIGPKYEMLTVISATESGMRGKHAENLLVIVDEATGLLPWQHATIESWMSNAGPEANVKLLMLANPSETSGVLYDAFHMHAEDWELESISAYDTPAFTGEIVPASVLAELPSHASVDLKRRAAQRNGDEDRFGWMVEAGFPKKGGASIIRLDRLTEAQERSLPDNDPLVLWNNPVLAADLSSGRGNDRSVIALAEGPRARVLHSTRDSSLGTVVALIIETAQVEFERMYNEKLALGRTLYPSDFTIVVDANGMGERPAEELEDALQPFGFNVERFYGGAGVANPEHAASYPNRRSEAWFTFAELLHGEDGEVPMDLPASPGLVGELTGVGYKNTPRGRQVEDKGKSKSRLGRSPDEADAILMLYAPRPIENTGFVG